MDRDFDHPNSRLLSVSAAPHKFLNLEHIDIPHASPTPSLELNGEELILNAEYDVEELEITIKGEPLVESMREYVLHDDGIGQAHQRTRLRTI